MGLLRFAVNRIVAATVKTGSFFDTVESINNVKYQLQCTVRVTLDERTCTRCRAFSNKKITLPKIYTFSDVATEKQNIIIGASNYSNLPKYHTSCRCTVEIELVKV